MVRQERAMLALRGVHGNDKLGVSERQIQRWKRDLFHSGLLAEYSRSGRTSILVPCLESTRSAQDDDRDTGGGVTGSSSIKEKEAQSNVLLAVEGVHNPERVPLTEQMNALDLETREPEPINADQFGARSVPTYVDQPPWSMTRAPISLSV